MTARIIQLVVHCDDVATQSRFWSEVLGRKVDDGASPDYAAIGAAERDKGGTVLMFLRAPVAKTGQNRLHLDLIHSDQTSWREEVDRVIELGASLVAEHEGFGWRWATMIDPEGNEFDLGVNPAVDS